MNSETKAAYVKCNFAAAGTYGHECSREAICFFVKKSDYTKSGYFYAGRCADCIEIRGGENDNTIRREPLAGQKNEWQ